MSLDRRITVAAAWLAMAGVACAEERLQLEPLLQQAIQNNPEILAAQKRLEAARLRGRSEGALPDPMIGAGWNSSGGPLPFQGVGREPVANVGVMVTQPLPSRAKRSLREQVANKEAEAEAQNYYAAQRSVASRLKQAYFRLQHTWESQELLERSRELLKRLLGIAEIRYSVGKAMQADVLRLQTQLSLVETRLVQYRRERGVREAEINALLNRSEATPLPQPVEPHATPILHTPDELIRLAAENSPMLRRDEKEIQRNELSLALARRETTPDLSVTGGYYYMGSMPSMYMFRVDMNVPLPWSRRIQPAIAAEANGLIAARRTLQASTRNLEYRIREDYLMANTALDLMKLYKDTLIPQANLTFESSLSSYETGTGGFSEVLMNAMAALDYEMNWHEEMQNYHLALSRLEEMSGADLIHLAGGRP